MDACPEDIRGFFMQAITESQERGIQVYWGTTGFSLRVQDRNFNRTTLFYGFPHGGLAKDAPIAQGYVGYIDDVGYREQVRQRYLKIPGATPSGQYTVTLELNAQSLENAKKLLEVVWDVSAEISKHNGQESIQA